MQERGNIPFKTTFTFGISCAFLSLIATAAWTFDLDMPWVNNFLFRALDTGIAYMGVFFHEIGHSVVAWFYGFASIPTFDFQHGGGMAYIWDVDRPLILACVWFGMAYGLYAYRTNALMRNAIIIAAIVNLSFAFNDYYEVLILYAGPLAEPIIASFFLYRALLNLAARGAFERFLNVYFAFGLFGHTFIQCFSILYHSDRRFEYFHQKDGHGHGDYDRIADHLPFLGFEGVVWVSIIFSIAAFALPLFLYRRERLWYAHEG